MVRAMKNTEFEQLLSLYGPDISLWPEASQKSAEAFAETKAGKALIEAEAQLADLFAASVATGHEHIEDRNVDAFLARLETIPSHHEQVVEVKPGWFNKFRAFLASMEVELSPAALASQMAALVVALGMGIMVGFNSGAETEFADTEAVTEIDISTDWFSGGNDLGQSAETSGE